MQSDLCAVIEILLNLIFSSGFRFHAFRHLYNQHITLLHYWLLLEMENFKAIKQKGF